MGTGRIHSDMAEPPLHNRALHIPSLGASSVPLILDPTKAFCRPLCSHHRLTHQGFPLSTSLADVHNYADQHAPAPPTPNLISLPTAEDLPQSWAPYLALCQSYGAMRNMGQSRCRGGQGEGCILQVEKRWG